METKYFNDAIIGNKNMVVSFSKTGEILRRKATGSGKTL